MPKTFEILKKRWMEVVFLMTLTSLPTIHRLFFNEQLAKMNASGRVTDEHLQLIIIAMFIVMLLVGVVTVFFNAGFLRTACVDGVKKQGIWAMFKTGIPFFPPLFVILFLEKLLATGSMYPAKYVLTQYGKEAYEAYSWAWWLIPLVVTIAVLKLRLFIPALIVARKLNIVTAFKALKNYRLFAAIEVLTLFVISWVFGQTGYRLFGFAAKSLTGYYAGTIVLNLIINLLSLAVMLSAVRFIAENTETACEADLTAEDAESREGKEDE